MDEASRCDRILLLRDGQLLADDEPAALLARTGARDMEEAFLRLCDERGGRGMTPRAITPGDRAAGCCGQLRHDHRTVALLLVVPSLLLTLLWWIYSAYAPQVFDNVGAVLVCLFPFLVMFLVTSIATLRERTSGTLERLLTMPLGKLDLLLGYALAFGLVGLVQAGIAVARGGRAARPRPRRCAVAAPGRSRSPMRCSASRSGLFASAFARTEFQAVQFMPVVVLPQFLLAGFLLPARGDARRAARDLERPAAVVRDRCRPRGDDLSRT